jgi:transcriptional regulator with XRE-family HTH domain
VSIAKKNQEIGQRIAEARKLRDMTQQAVADGMRDYDPDHQWSQSTVWAIEKGERALRAAEIDDLARLLRTAPTFLASHTESANAIRRLVYGDQELSGVIYRLDPRALRGAIERLREACEWAQGVYDEDPDGEGDDPDSDLASLPIRVDIMTAHLQDAEELLAVLQRVINDHMTRRHPDGQQ